jgi:hypothetical protein
MTVSKERFYIRRTGNIISFPKKLHSVKSNYVYFSITLQQFNHWYWRATNTKRKAPYSAYVQIGLIISNFTCFYCTLRSSASTVTADSLNTFRTRQLWEVEAFVRLSFKWYIQAQCRERWKTRKLMFIRKTQPFLCLILTNINSNFINSAAKGLNKNFASRHMWNYWHKNCLVQNLKETVT